MTNGAKSERAPNGVLRAGINLSNFLLVSDQALDGGPIGVSPDMAQAIADRLDVDVQFVTFASPGELAAVSRALAPALIRAVVAHSCAFKAMGLLKPRLDGW